MKEIRVFGLLIGLIIIAVSACKHEPFVQPVDLVKLPCDSTQIYYPRDIEPILVANCAIPQCHNASSAQDGVILSSYSETVNTTKVDEKGVESDFFELLSGQKYSPGDANSIMPPEGRTPLSDEQVELIRLWIEQGVRNIDCIDCDTSQISFNQDVLPIFARSCQPNCHSGNSPAAGISLEGYMDIRNNTEFGTVLAAINHEPTASPMPKGGGKLSDCDISKVQAWVNANYPNN